ncbi:MAG TPA: APC family permease [Actinomycetota bacterium]
MTTLQRQPTGRGSLVKRLLLGRPLASEESGHQLLPKILALPVFASDALSSVAYATEEIMHVLIAAGSARLRLSMPLAGAVGLLMVIVITSYRQTVRVYNRGGGAYIVAKENIGTTPGLIAGAALLTDYVLTVAVSISAGAFAIASLAPSMNQHRVGMALGFVALITLMNLRGAKESGSLFAIPTYAFIMSILTMLAVGIARCTLGECPQAETAHETVKTIAPLTLFLILRAFSSGATALTGVEAIADGVSAFRGRRPAEQANNAAATLGILGIISIVMFLGITLLANQMNVHPSEDRSVVAQIANAAFGGGPGFVIVQIATALILVLAANTAYQDFPRLSSILARDRFVPRQFINRGDRLVFSNGILVLAFFASLLIVLYDAEVTRLIQLYVVGVFTSFTLSQAGMVRRWRRLRPAGWQSKALINAIGASTTGVVLVVVAITKFTHGAWIVIAASGLLVLSFRAIHRHYTDVSTRLRRESERPERPMPAHVVIPVARIDEATLRAIGYAKMIRPVSIRAVHVADEGDVESDLLPNTWAEWNMGFELEVLRGTSLVAGVRDAIRRTEVTANETRMVLIPERLRNRGWLQFLRSRRGLLLKTRLLFEPNLVVTDVPMVESPHRRPTGSRPLAPVRNEAVVLVSAVHNASLRAVSYAVGLRPTDIRAVTFAVDEEDTQQLTEDWTRQPFDVPLEILDSPYREVRKPLVRLIRELKAEAPGTIVTVVLPEFVVRKRWHQILHNQTALAIKARLLFEPDVVVTSVPFHLNV